jgi:hypothetical protein
MKDLVVKTTAFKFIEGGIGWLVDEPKEKLGLFWGEPGYGKTTAIKLICSQFNGIYLEAIQGWSPYHFVNHLLKISSGEKSRSFAGALEGAIDYLQASRRPVFIDECERLLGRIDLVEAVRVIHDQGNVPVVLIGMTGSHQRILQYPLFFDRFRYLGEVPRATLADIEEISRLCEVKFDSDILNAIFEDQRIACNCRRVAWALGRIEKWAFANDLGEVNLQKWDSRSFLPEFPTGNSAKILPLVRGV